MNRTSISDIKMKAKDNLLGCYGLAAGSFALIIVLMYGLTIILMGALSKGISMAELSSGNLSTITRIEQLGISLVIGVFSAILTTGFTYQMMEVSYGRRPKTSGLFFCFKNHPDKVIIIYAILAAIQFIVMLPSEMVSWSMENVLTGQDGKKFLLKIVLLLAGFLINAFFTIIFGFCFLIYIDDPEMSVKDIMMCSQKLMKGNFFRYIYLFLSFIGYYVAGIFSLGVTLMYSVPYQNMAMVEFYKDALKCVDTRRADGVSTDESVDIVKKKQFEKETEKTPCETGD